MIGNHTSEHSEKLVVSRFSCAILQTMTNILSSILMLLEFTYLVCKFTGPVVHIVKIYKFFHFVGFTSLSLVFIVLLPIELFDQNKTK